MVAIADDKVRKLWVHCLPEAKIDPEGEDVWKTSWALVPSLSHSWC
jgi:hypothetical protein